MSTDQTSSDVCQDFFDNGQYSMNGILRYEKIFGNGFISTGGSKSTEEFCKLVSWKSNPKVLDIGCGIGGSAIYMAKTFGANVIGIDLSTNMIKIANERKATLSKDLQDMISFKLMDATMAEFPAGNFDLIYSRDAIMHIYDKKGLYSSLLKWLKPGGQVLVTDYALAYTGESSLEGAADFKEYIIQRGYNLLLREDYQCVLEKVGFVDVDVLDKTDYFVDVLLAEMEKFEREKDTFIKEFTEEDYNDILDGWKIKLQRVNAGHLKWNMVLAKGPSC